MRMMTRWVAFVSMGVGASQRIPFSFLARNPYKGLAHEISHETGRGRGEDNRQKRREGMSQQKGAEDSCLPERADKRRSVKRWEQGREETSQQKSERRLLRPVDQQMPVWPTREDKSALLVDSGSFARVHVRVSPQKYRMHKSVINFSLLALGAKPSPSLFVLFLPPLRLCILCVVKGIWNTPGHE